MGEIISVSAQVEIGSSGRWDRWARSDENAGASVGSKKPCKHVEMRGSTQIKVRKMQGSP